MNFGLGQLGRLGIVGIANAIRQLLGLPSWDSTGKLNPGLWTEARSSVLRVVDNEGMLVEVDGGELGYEGARYVRNLWPQTDSSDSPTTQVIAVISGHEYQLQIGAGSASGATAVCSGAFTGTLTGDGSNIISWPNGTPKAATTTSLTITIAGAVTNIQLEDVTGANNQNPSEYQEVS